MHAFEEPGLHARLSRTEVELELARIALIVMRAAPGSSEDSAGSAPGGGTGALPERCTRLLARASPEHRSFVEDRLRELARSLAGGRAAIGPPWMETGTER